MDMFGGGGKSPEEKAMEIQEAQMKRLSELELPELEEYLLQNPELVGLLEAEGIDPSAMGDIQLDPAMKEKQMQALQGLAERSEQGLTDQDKMVMEDMLGQVGAQERSQRASIEQDMARKGTGDSGTSLMAKLNASQGGANTARQKAMQMAAQGQINKMNALQSMGQMAGSMENVDYGRQANAASAKDAIAKANAMNRQNVNAANLSAQQSIENQRAGIANQQAQVGNQIKQQNYNNAYTKAGGQGQVANSMSQIAGNSPQKPGALQAGLAGGISGFAATGNPWGAAAGAGLGVLSSFEDGGIAKSQDRELKQHDKFKSDYMKRVRQELTPQEEAKKEVTGQIHAEGGFGVPDALTGAEPTMEDMVNFDFKEAGKTKEGLNSFLNKGNAITESVNTDRQINDFGDYQVDAKNKEMLGNITDDVMARGESPEASGMSSSDLQKGAKALSGILGNGKSKRKKLKLGAYNQPKIQNIMTPIQQQQFGNPMAKFGAALENGGLPSYECGGVHSGTTEAEDGEVMFDSEGEGAIVGGDSFERDRVDARLNSGEAVLNVAQQQRLMDILRGEESVDNLGGDDIVEGVPESYQEELTEDIDGEEVEDMRVSGLKKLLSALGEG